jgi:hypothetical protein
MLLPAVALLVAGCLMEEVTYGYTVVNYSSNTYIVRVTFQDGVVAAISSAPGSRTGQDRRPSPTVRAVVYEGDCSHEVADLHANNGISYIVIDKSGNVTAPAMMSNFDVTAVPYQELPVPSLCP